MGEKGTEVHHIRRVRKPKMDFFLIFLFVYSTSSVSWNDVCMIVSTSGVRNCIPYNGHCFKITLNVSFEFFNLGIFYQFLSLKS